MSGTTFVLFVTVIVALITAMVFDDIRKMYLEYSSTDRNNVTSAETSATTTLRVDPCAWPNRCVVQKIW